MTKAAKTFISGLFVLAVCVYH